MAIATGCSVLLLIEVAADRRAHASAQSGARELRHARAVLAAELAPLRARDLVTVSDTLVAVMSQLGVVQLCATDSASVDVALSPGVDAAVWLDALKADDQLLAWVAEEPLSEIPREADARLTAPARRLGAGACGAMMVRQRWRLSVRVAGAPMIGTPMIGAPVVLQREVQFVHYRSNGQWWLGRRARDGGTWEIVQPVAGPLESPSRGGLTARGLTAARQPTGATDSMALIALTLRVPARHRPGSTAIRRVVLPPDSLVTELPLRAASWSRGAP